MTTPAVILDLRCEFDVPRFCDIRKKDDGHDAEENFAWFQTPHDFEVPSSQKVEKELRQRILRMGSPGTGKKAG